jgi:hypothetical protein
MRRVVNLPPAVRRAKVARPKGKTDRTTTSSVSDAEGRQMADATESESDFQFLEPPPDPQLLLPADLRSDWVVVPRAVLEWQQSSVWRAAVCVAVWLASRDLNSWSGPLCIIAWLCIEFGGGLNARMRTAGTLRGRVHPDPLSYRTPPPSPPSRGWRRL